MSESLTNAYVDGAQVFRSSLFPLEFLTFITINHNIPLIAMIDELTSKRRSPINILGDYFI